MKFRLQSYLIFLLNYAWNFILTDESMQAKVEPAHISLFILPTHTKFQREGILARDLFVLCALWFMAVLLSAQRRTSKWNNILPDMSWRGSRTKRADEWALIISRGFWTSWSCSLAESAATAVFCATRHYSFQPESHYFNKKKINRCAREYISNTVYLSFVAGKEIHLFDGYVWRWKGKRLW